MEGNTRDHYSSKNIRGCSNTILHLKGGKKGEGVVKNTFFELLLSLFVFIYFSDNHEEYK